MSDSLLQEPLQWHTKAWQHITEQLERDSLSHAYILAAEADTGKSHFAKFLAHALLCSQPVQYRACGECNACKLNASGNHPDLYNLSPQGNSKQIGVDQIRELRKFLETSSHAFGRRVIILDSAENLGISSANALLKGLEEPPAGVLFLLLSDRPKAVLPTISSRAQTLRVGKPTKSQSLQWLSHELELSENEANLLLELAMDRPMSAYEMHESGLKESLSKIAGALLDIAKQAQSPSKIARDLAKTNAGDTIRLMLLWISTLIKAQLSANMALVHDKALSEFANTLNLRTNLADEQAKALFSLYNELVKAQRQLSSGSNPNAQLVLEDLFIKLQGLSRQNAVVVNS
ncbi:MAG: DNA polymerase III subunit delta' [Pseudohongiellaceae bacterium]|nr:DNA polymerase III subunit delta' [Pseudohongiellaceae bacterium]